MRKSLKKITTLTVVAVFATLSLTTPLYARQLDLAKPEDAVLASRKITCGSLAEDYIAYAVWKGTVFSRVSWERDRHLFDVIGFNVRRCAILHDPERGDGYRMISREVMLYLKPGTEEIVDVWENPFTGREVKVIHVANDPVNPYPRFPYSSNGKPYRFNGEIIGDLVVRRIEVPLYYKNPLSSAYQEEVGGAAQAIELFTYFIDRDELLTDSEDPLTSLHLTWNRMARWTPWMKMGDHPGSLIFSAYGWRVQSYDEVPDLIRENLEQDEFALYKEPPPADDPRPSMNIFDRYRVEVPRDENQ